MTALYAMERPGTNQLLLLGWFADESSQLDIENAQFSRKCKTYIYTSLQFAAAFFAFSRPANATYVSLRSMYLYLSLFLAFCRMFCFLLPSHTKSGLSGGQFDWHCFIAKTGEVRFLELQSNFDCQESTTKKTHLGMQIYTPVN